MARIVKVFAGVLSLCMAGVLAPALYLQAVLPDRFYVAEGQTLQLDGPWGVHATGLAASFPVEVYSRNGNSYRMRLQLPGGISVKDVSVEVVRRETVIPGGIPFGIKMFTQGVMVVGFTDVEVDGKTENPARAAGIQAGDILLKIGDSRVNSNEEVARAIAGTQGQPVRVLFEREGASKMVTIQPVCPTGQTTYKAGMWVRDSSAGIGTLTYYDPSTGVFAGLGHAVCDVDTGCMMPLASGEAVRVQITGVTRGVSGMPGELRGTFSGTAPIGSLFYNGETGVFGRSSSSPLQQQPVEVALRQEVQAGPAQILTTVEGDQPQAYDVLIEKVNFNEANPTKNMVIRVTDPALLAKTGGIVQGMSGSPILQNGKLVGAVTHVFVNDPTKGYGIFAENMQQTANNAAPSFTAAA